MDTFTPQERTTIMRSIESNNTRLEVAVRSAIWRRGLRFRKKTSLPGKPDIVFKRAKTVVFLDSCFWHGCAEHCRMPKSNQGYWNNKIQRNRNRDVEIKKLSKNGLVCDS